MTAAIQADHNQVTSQARDALNPLIALDQVLGQLKGAEALLSIRNALPPSQARVLRHVAKLVGPMREFCKSLPASIEENLAARDEYQPHLVTLNRRTNSEQREDPHAYSLLARDTRRLIAQQLTSGFLAAPGSGAVVASHLQDNVHAHVLYWGPLPKGTASEWVKATEDSDQVRVDSLPGPDDVARVAGYLSHLPREVDPVHLVMRDHALGRTRLLERYGAYRRYRND
jgi:hypothetical protein